MSSCGWEPLIPFFFLCVLQQSIVSASVTTEAGFSSRVCSLVSFLQFFDPRNLHRLLLIFLCKVVNSSNMVYSTSLSSSQLPMAGETFLDGTIFCLVPPRRRSFRCHNQCLFFRIICEFLVPAMHKQSNQARCIVFPAITETENPPPNTPKLLYFHFCLSVLVGDDVRRFFGL